MKKLAYIFIFLVLICFIITGFLLRQIYLDMTASKIRLARLEVLQHDQAITLLNQKLAIQQTNDTTLKAQGIYFNGECVPTPSCPVNFKPNIYVIPLSVNNISYDNQSIAIKGFGAYAIGPALTNELKNCQNTGIEQCTNRSGQSIPATQQTYWRVCLSTVTDIVKKRKSVKQVIGSAENNYISGVFTQCDAVQ